MYYFLSQSPLKTTFSVLGTVAITEYSGRSFQKFVNMPQEYAPLYVICSFPFSTGPGPINERVLPYDAAHPDGVPIVFYPTNHISAEISGSVRNNTPQDQSKPQ